MEFSLEISKKVQGFVEFVQKQQKSWLTFEKYGQAEKKYRWAHTCPFGSLEKCFIFPGKKGPLHWTSWPLWKNLPIQTYSAHIKAMIPPSLSPLVFTFCLIFQCYCIPSFNMNLCRFEDFHLGHHTIWNILYKDRKLCKNKYSGKKGSVFLFNKPSFSHVV